MFAFDKPCNPLQIAVATADKADVVEEAVFVDVEKNLSGASPLRVVSVHK